MSEEELQEAIEYNRKYIEAQLSEELFGGDYTSAVELEASATSYKRLQQENEELKENYCNRTDCSSRIKDSKKYDSLQQRIDKAIEYIKENEYWFDGDDLQIGLLESEVKELLNILEGDK